MVITNQMGLMSVPITDLIRIPFFPITGPPKETTILIPERRVIKLSEKNRGEVIKAINQNLILNINNLSEGPWALI